MTTFPMIPGVPAAGHLSRGFWHPGSADGCAKCPPERNVAAERALRTARRLADPALVKMTEALVGCSWGREVSSVDDPDACPEAAVRIVVVHRSDAPPADLRLCERHCAVVEGATTPRPS